MQGIRRFQEAEKGQDTCVGQVIVAVVTFQKSNANAVRETPGGLFGTTCTTESRKERQMLKKAFRYSLTNGADHYL